MPTRFIFATLLALSGVFALPSVSFAVESVVYQNFTSPWTASYDINPPLVNNGNGIEESSEDRTFHITFSASTTYRVNKIVLWEIAQRTNSVATSSGCNLSVDNCDKGFLWIWKAATSTFATDKTFVELTDIYYEDDGSGNFTAVAEFLNYFYLIKDQTYIFEYQPWDGTPALSDGYFPRTYASTSTSVFNGNTYTYDADAGYQNGGRPYASLGFQLYDTGDTTEEVPLSISEPCIVNSYDRQPCTVGTTDYGEDLFIEIVGTSTPLLSTDDGYYWITANWYDGAGSIVAYDSMLMYIDHGSVPFSISLLRDSDDVDTYLSRIEVCQTFDSWAWIGGVYGISTEPDYCADILVGYQLTTASTTELGTVVGAIRDTDPENPIIVNTADLCTQIENGYAEGTLTEKILCEIKSWFVPDSTQLVSYAKTTLNALANNWPFGYVTREMQNYVLATSSAFVISLDMSSFRSSGASSTGITNLTASGTPVSDLDISAMASYARTLDEGGLIETVENFIWAFFWIFLALRIVSKTWYALGSGAETISADYVREERGRIARDRANKNFVARANYISALRRK